MKLTDFCCVDTDSGKLKVTLIFFDGCGLLGHETLKSAVSPE